MAGITAGLIVSAGFGLLISFVFGPKLPDVPGGGLLIVANKGDHTISVVDPAAGREVGRVKESGVTGHEVAASPDGRTVVVPIYGNSGVGQPGTDGQSMDVIDLHSLQRTATIQFPKAVRPHCAVFGPDGMLYVSSELADEIAIIDPRTWKIVGTVPTGQPESHMLAINHNGTRAYTSNVHAGTVSAIDLPSRKVLAVIPISKEAQRISLTPDGRQAFTADQTAPRLAVIDTRSNTVRSWISLPGIGYGTCATPDSRWLIVALINVNKIGIIDLESMKLTRTIDVPKAPQEVLVRPDGRAAYVSCDASRRVVVLEVGTWKIDKEIDVGPGADGLAWAPGR